MTSIRQMNPTDLLHFNTCNLDPLTETYHTSFYTDYFSRWPSLCLVIESPEGIILGYMLGKLEASPYPPAKPYDPSNPYFRGSRGQNYLPYHAHVTCLTVSPAARRMGLATRLTAALEAEGDRAGAWFVDLFVRKSNAAAVKLYEGLGYSVWRTVREYYGDGEDAWDMRKPLKRDKERQTVREGGKEAMVDPADVW